MPKKKQRQTKAIHAYGIRILNARPPAPGWIQSIYGKTPARYVDKHIAQARMEAIAKSSPHLKMEVQPL